MRRGLPTDPKGWGALTRRQGAAMPRQQTRRVEARSDERGLGLQPQRLAWQGTLRISPPRRTRGVPHRPEGTVRPGGARGRLPGPLPVAQRPAWATAFAERPTVWDARRLPPIRGTGSSPGPPTVAQHPLADRQPTASDAAASPTRRDSPFQRSERADAPAQHAWPDAPRGERPSRIGPPRQMGDVSPSGHEGSDRRP
jgi:hypothetical protein